MNEIKFVAMPQSVTADNGELIVHLSQVRGSLNLFRQLSEQLRFPDYFGWNWDALNDCLNDFHWTNEQPVILIHNDWPHLNSEEFLIYFDILTNSVQRWRESGICFTVIFSNAYRDLVTRYLTG